MLFFRNHHTKDRSKKITGMMRKSGMVEGGGGESPLVDGRARLRDGWLSATLEWKEGLCYSPRLGGCGQGGGKGKIIRVLRGNPLLGERKEYESEKQNN